MGKGMLVRTDFPRFDEMYTVSVEERKPGSKPLEGQPAPFFFLLLLFCLSRQSERIPKLNCKLVHFV